MKLQTSRKKYKVCGTIKPFESICLFRGTHKIKIINQSNKPLYYSDDWDYDDNK